VQHHLETFLARAAEACGPDGSPVPVWVERDFRAYLRCGIPAHGFARLRCADCGHERILPFSCKGRGVCPSCNARRMAEVAAHLTDHVLPHLPLRQWVLSLPKRLRPYLHHDARLAGAVLRIFATQSARQARPADRPARSRRLRSAAGPLRSGSRSSAWALRSVRLPRPARSGLRLPEERRKRRKARRQNHRRRSHLLFP
jgi:hypothetical protein